MPTDRPSTHDPRRFDDSGSLWLLTGVNFVVLGGLIHLLGTVTAPWVRACGTLIVLAAAGIALVGVAMLLVALVVHHAPRHRVATSHPRRIA